MPESRPRAGHHDLRGRRGHGQCGSASRRRSCAPAPPGPGGCPERHTVTAVGQLGNDRRAVAFWAASSSLVVTFAASSSPIPLFNTYRIDNGLSTADIAHATVAYFLTTIAALLCLGRLANHLGRRPAALISLLLVLAGAVVLIDLIEQPRLARVRKPQGRHRGSPLPAGPLPLDVGQHLRARHLHRMLGHDRQMTDARTGTFVNSCPHRARPERGPPRWHAGTMTPAPRHLVAVLGRGVLDPDAPAVTADDLGLTRGDGCFDSARVTTDPMGTARVVDLPDHLARLARSARALAIACPPDAQWAALVDAALSRWSIPGEATLKLVLTRGREWRDSGPTALITLTHRGPARTPAADEPAPTIRAVTLSSGRPARAFADAPWLLGGVKTLAYAVNVAALREARARGAADAIFTSTDGYALEGTTSALLVARAGALLATPVEGTGILESVTVARIFDLAPGLGLDTRYELVPVEDLSRADGVWLVSSSRGPVQVSTLDGRDLDHDPETAARVLRMAGF